MDDAEGVLGRSLRVLQCFTDDEPALTAARLGEITRLPPSTLHRLLAQLTQYWLVSRAPGHRYTIGARLWELGELSPRSGDPPGARSSATTSSGATPEPASTRASR